MQVFHAALNGVNFRPAETKEYVKNMTIGQIVDLERDPENVYDQNAIKVLSASADFLGFIEKEIAAEIAPLLDAGATVHRAAVSSFLTAIKPHLRIEIDEAAAPEAPAAA